MRCSAVACKCNKLVSSRAGDRTWSAKPGRGRGNRHGHLPAARPAHAPPPPGVRPQGWVGSAPGASSSSDGCLAQGDGAATGPGAPPQQPCASGPGVRGRPPAGPSAATPTAPGFRLRLARTEQDFAAVAGIWAEALLLPGLTELQPPHPADSAELQRPTAQTAARLTAAHQRKLRAAAATRVLRARGQALLAALRRGGGGGGEGSLSGMELLMKRRQLEAIRRELRRARRRRMWACLLAYAEAGTGEQPPQAAEQPLGPRAAEGEEEAEEEGGQGAAECAAEEGRLAAASTPRVQGPDGGGVHPPSVRHSPHSEPHPRPRRVHLPHHHHRPQSHTHDQPHPHGLAPSSSATPPPLQSSPHSHPLPPQHQQQQQEQQQARPAGYVLVSLSQPLALLPPPLPSRAPLCPHVDALAVAPGWRRMSAGAALLAAAEQLAGRWGSSSLWLHVDAANDGAVQLYTDAGYRVARVLQPQSRLAAALAALPAALLAAAAAAAADVGAGGRGPAREGWLGRSAAQSRLQQQDERPLAAQQSLPPQPQPPQPQPQQPPKLRGRQFVMQKQLRRAPLSVLRRPSHGGSGAGATATQRPAATAAAAVEGGQQAAATADNSTGGGRTGAEEATPDLARPQQQSAETATDGGACVDAATASTARTEPQSVPAERGLAGKAYDWRA